MPLKVGIIGYGGAGRLLHAPLIEAAGFEIVGAVTSRASELTEDFPRARAFESAEALCASDAELIVIASPDHLHAEQAHAALAAGKHVVIDKPIAQTSAAALALAVEAERRSLLLSVFHNRRWDNDFLTVRRLIKDNALGDVVHYAARWDRYRPNASGNWREQHMQGELFGLGSHLMDQVLVLFGAPDWLMADVYKQRAAPGQSDGFEIVMGKGRQRLTLGLNLLAADELRAYRVLGERGAFTKTGLDPQEQNLRDRMSATDPKLGVEDEANAGTLIGAEPRTTMRIVSQRGDWLSYYRALHAAITDKTPPPVSAREATRVIAMLEAALESSRTGQRIDIAAWLATRG